MTTYTPGPWRVGAKYQCDIYANRTGHPIAKTVNPQFEGECEANARLIAAAPCLLKACKLFLEYEILENGSAMVLAYNAAHDAICAAIAKAEGGKA